MSSSADPSNPLRDPSTWESAVVVRVPSLDRALAELRERFDLPRKPNGIPAHVTLIVPFLPAARLDTDTMAALQDVCTRVDRFDVRFNRTGRFRHVLYLEPEPRDPFVELTTLLIERWPELQPYAGAHREVVPHLTVTTSPRQAVLNRVTAAAQSLLPHSAGVDAARLYRFDGRRWSEDANLPLGSPPPRS